MSTGFVLRFRRDFRDRPERAIHAALDLPARKGFAVLKGGTNRLTTQVVRVQVWVVPDRGLCRFAACRLQTCGGVRIEKILLVDDDPEVRAVGELCLVHVGHFEVVLAESGAQALELAVREHPSLALIDVRMPAMDGPALVEALRAHEETASLPVIFLTGAARPDEIEKWNRLGGLGVITKPFDPLSLVDQVRRLTGYQEAA